MLNIKAESVPKTIKELNGDVVAKEELLNQAKAQLVEAQKANVELRQKVAKEKEALRDING